VRVWLITLRYYANLDNIEIPDDIIHSNDHLVRVIENIKQRHAPVVNTMAQGIQEYKDARGAKHIDIHVQSFLDRFYMSRIGIRMLIGQHIALNKPSKDPNYVGIICTKTKVGEIAQEATDNARFICEDYYGLFRAPEVKLHCPEILEFSYVPSHLHHMLFELLKKQPQSCGRDVWY